MLGRSQILRAVAIIALVACCLASVAAMHRRPAAVSESSAAATSVPDDLSAELRRCSGIGPNAAADAGCPAVWEENRRRFFGKPSRTVPPQAPAVAVTPAPPSSGDAR